MKNYSTYILEKHAGSFMFWLAQQYLPAYNNYKKQIQPINNHEFYGTLTMIIIALLALKMIF
jgi:hypothetical protein